MSDEAVQSDSTRTLAAPVPLVAIVGWLVPGSGYWLIGHRTRAIVICATILALFLFGLLVGGIRVIESPDFVGRGTLVSRILEKPWFIGQVFVGPVGLVSSWIAQAAAGSSQYGSIVSHARLAEIGTLYTAVAGMLNLLAIIDASHRAAKAGE